MKLASTDFANAMVTIYDVAGKAVKSEIITEAVNEIEIKTLSKGVYFMKVQLDDKVSVKQIEVR
jgi:hypothetical protein